MNAIIIRTATPDDSSAVEMVSKASYDHHFPAAYEAEVLSAVLPVITKASAMLLESGHFFVAEMAEGEVVGCGGWSEEKPGTRERDGETAHLRHFAVAPNAGGAGIGRQIFTACHAQAATTGLTRLEVLSSLNATAFYARMGFAETGPRTAMIAGTLPFPAIDMHRHI